MWDHEQRTIAAMTERWYENLILIFCSLLSLTLQTNVDRFFSLRLFWKSFVEKQFLKMYVRETIISPSPVLVITNSKMFAVYWMKSISYWQHFLLTVRSFVRCCVDSRVFLYVHMCGILSINWWNINQLCAVCVQLSYI